MTQCCESSKERCYKCETSEETIQFSSEGGNVPNQRGQCPTIGQNKIQHMLGWTALKSLIFKKNIIRWSPKEPRTQYVGTSFFALHAKAVFVLDCDLTYTDMTRKPCSHVSSLWGKLCRSYPGCMQDPWGVVRTVQAASLGTVEACQDTGAP